MRWLNRIARAICGLFVDDVPFTASILAWIAVGSLGLPRTGLDAAWDAPVLFLGCALILIVSARQAAAQRREQRSV